MGLFSLFSKKPQEPGDDLDVPVKPRRSRAAKAQEDEPLDPMLPEKKRARRRLIGATALVLAAVIGLPMVFDSEPKPLSDDIEIQIPSRDKTEPAASRPMPLPPDAAPDESKADAPVDLPAVKPSASKPAPDAAVKAPSTDEKKSSGTEKKLVAEEKKPAADEKKPASTEKKPVVDDKKSAAPKTAAKAESTVAAVRPSDKPADAGKGRFIIQVAAVSSHAKAEDLQNRLKKAGIKSYSQKVSTKDGERYRIRVGPFASREEADRIRGRLALLGLSGTVQPL